MNYYSKKRTLYAFVGVFMLLIGISLIVIGVIYANIIIGIIGSLLVLISSLPLLESWGINHLTLSNEQLTLYRYPFYVKQIKLQDIREINTIKNWYDKEIIIIKTSDKTLKIHDAYDKNISIIKHDINKYLNTNYD